MRDKVTQKRVSELHPKIKADVEKGIDQIEAGWPTWMAVRVVQGDRSFEYQHQLYCQPTDKKDNDGDGKIDEADEKVTNADAGQSYHNYKLAFDVAVLYDKDKNGTFESISWSLVSDLDRDGLADWMEMVKVFEALGFEWGGRWPGKKADNPHFQRTYGYHWSELMKMYKEKKFIPGTQCLNI